LSRRGLREFPNALGESAHGWSYRARKKSHIIPKIGANKSRASRHVDCDPQVRPPPARAARKKGGSKK